MPGTLQGLFNFENNALDSSGLNRTMNPYSGVVPFSTVPAPPQGLYWAGDFAGNSYQCADALTNAMRNKNLWVFETYINLTSLGAADVIWCSYISQNRLQIDGAGTVIALFMNGTSVSTPYPFVAGTTYLISISYDSNTRKIYVNGLLVASDSGNGLWDAAFAPGSPTVIGDFIVPVGIQFKGKMDSMKFLTYTFSGDVPTSFPVSVAGTPVGFFLKRRRR